MRRPLPAQPPPSGLDEEEKQAFDHVAFFYKHGLGYAQEMGNRPQTLYGIEDSPVGLAAWIIDHDIWTYRLIARVFDGAAEGLTRDDILDNITLYWLTNTGVSSARLYWENKCAFFAPKGVKIPVVVSAFPEEICPVPRKWAERPIPSWSTTSAIRKARTLPRGSSRKRSWKIFAPGSSRCASPSITFTKGAEMNRQCIASIVIVAASIFVTGNALAQDKYTVKVPGGLAFSEFRGYESWEVVSVSEDGGLLAVIVANPVMIGAYKAGLPANGKPFPDGAKMAKIHYNPKKIETFPQQRCRTHCTTSTSW